VFTDIDCWGLSGGSLGIRKVTGKSGIFIGGDGKFWTLVAAVEEKSATVLSQNSVIGSDGILHLLVR